MRLAVITFDVEHDCPPYLDTYHGVEEGLPRILDLLAEKDVRAVFYFTAEAAKRYPRLARRVVEEGHELGSHGYAHERLDKLPPGSAVRAIFKSATVLSSYTDRLISFRAPNLQLPNYLLPVLVEAGFAVDSSLATYKPPFPRSPCMYDGLLRVPASVTSSVLRLPWRIQRAIHGRIGSPAIYFSHPWEYVDMRGRLLRPDCVFNTGEKALQLLARLIDYLRSRGWRLVTMAELRGILSPQPRCTNKDSI